MAATPLSNPKHMLIAIRYQFFKRIKKEEAYKIICKTVSITYKDFDFWWFRFSSGNYDLNAEPPKTRDFIDFPDNVLDKIVGKLSYRSRIAFRKTSKRNRQAVDNNIFIINEFQFISYKSATKLHIRRDNLFYETTEYSKTTIYRTEYYVGIESKDYMELAMKELIFAISQPNHRVKKLSILVQHNKIREDIEQGLQSLNRKIPVEHFKFDCKFYFGRTVYDSDYSDDSDDSDASEDEFDIFEGQNEVLKVIPYLEPGVLEHIELSSQNDRVSICVDKIAETEQWKRANRLTAGRHINFKIEDLANFKNIYLTSLKEEELVELKNILQKSPNFELCRIEKCFSEYRILNAFNADSLPFIDGSIQIDLIGRIITFKKIQ